MASHPFRAPGDTTGPIDNIGPHSFWGFTPAINLQERKSAVPLAEWDDTADADAASAAAAARPLNILMVGAADPRHLLRTIAERRRFSKRPLHFFVYDKPTEVLARHLLLLSIAQDWELPLRQRTNTLLEVFGNARLQTRTAEYVEAKGRELIELVTDERGALSDLVAVGELKYRVRDELESVLKSWAATGARDRKWTPFDVDGLREDRLRTMYGAARWDTRKGQVDWMYHQQLGCVLADPRQERRTCRILHKRQYWGWRETGVAFEFGDQEYVTPNRTLASFAEGLDRKRGAVARKGYWGDLLVSPFVALGLSCETRTKAAEGLFEVLNWNSGTEQQRHNAAEVAVHNVLAWLYETEAGRPYEMRQEHEVYSGLGDGDGEGEGDKGDKGEEGAGKEGAGEEESKGGAEAGAAAAAGAAAEDAEDAEFEACASFSGARPGFAFKTGPQGTGYYRSADAAAATTAAAAAEADATTSVAAAPPAAPPATAATAAAEAEKSAEQEAAAEAAALQRARTIIETLDGVKITLLGGSGVELSELFAKKKYAARFHHAYFSTTGVHYLDGSVGGGDVGAMLAPGAEVTVETAKYIWPLTEAQKATFNEKVDGYATARGWKPAAGSAKKAKGNASWDHYTFLA